MEAAAAATKVSIDFSPYGLFMHADGVVKAVMILLLLASIGCWAVIASKLGLYRRMRRQVREFDKAFVSGQSFDDLHAVAVASGPMGLGALFVAALEEWTTSIEENAVSPAAMNARVQLALDSALAAENERLAALLPFLATVASAAPFVGLFGTVWGIINAFTAIAASSNTSLAVVAPGIAEALAATALGLFAAIPAVIGYNRLLAESAWLVGRLEIFADRLAALLSRRLDAARTGTVASANMAHARRTGQ